MIVAPETTPVERGVGQVGVPAQAAGGARSERKSKGLLVRLRVPGKSPATVSEVGSLAVASPAKIEATTSDIVIVVPLAFVLLPEEPDE